MENNEKYIVERLRVEYENICLAAKRMNSKDDKTYAAIVRDRVAFLGNILGYTTKEIRDCIEGEPKEKTDSNIKCKNHKNKDVIEYIENLKKDVLKAEKECDVLLLCAVSESFGVASGSIGSASQLAAAIAFLISDIERHSKKGVSLMPMIITKYAQVKAEMSGKHDGDD